MRASADILSHSFNTKISQIVNSLESIDIVFHHLITVAWGFIMLFSDSIAFSALYSWINPKTEFKITIATMTTASTTSHMTAETIVAPIKINIKALLN